MVRYKVITEPSTEPLTTAEVKAHLYIDGSDHDDYIDALIIAARQQAEAYTNRKFIETVVEEYFTGWSDCFRLYWSSLIEIVSIKYIDSDGIEQTLDGSQYKISNGTNPPEILKEYGITFPDVRTEENNVIIRYKAGFGDEAANVPQAIKQAMLLTIGHWFENREDTAKRFTNASQILLNNYRIWAY